MSKKTLIKGAALTNEGQISHADLLISRGRIERIDTQIELPEHQAHLEVNAEGLHLFPGVIDDQVHFREPGLTHKACIATESRAAIAGGVTSFMEMPNTTPPAVTIEELEKKYAIAANTSSANYSFFLGATNNNLSEIERADSKTICGVKIFMGSSTGNMLVDNEQALENIFANCEMLIATHCEDEQTIKDNLAKELARNPNPDASRHPVIRNIEGCWLSSSKAAALAKKHNSRLHILHISTAKECDLFEKGPVKTKRITSEACVHHLWFTADDYDRLGNKIKCNPAIKAPENRAEILKAVFDDRIDIIATDHAPHTSSEKEQAYLQAPSGLPLVQHSLSMMLDIATENQIPLTRIVDKMCHAPADCFNLSERGFLREGYFADLVLVDLERPFRVQQDQLHYRCAWSPLEGHTFGSTIKKTFVNGHIAYEEGKISEERNAQRLLFT